MKLLIALYHPFELWNAPPWFAERLRAEFPQLEVQQIERYQGMGDALAESEIAIAWSIRPEDFARARRLKWVHSTAAAVHQLMFPELVASNVMVTNSRNVHAPVVAEHAITLVLALAKRLPQCMAFQQQAKWAQAAIYFEKPTVRELSSSTAVVFGMGSIGREFTRRAKALGMHVIAVREHPERGPAGADEVVSPDQLTSILPRADFVVLAAPVTSRTKHVISSAALAAMRNDAYLVNVGRGPLIEDSALIAALESKTIAGAALDVFAEEPLPPDSPYWRLTNVLITPHTAAVTENLWERQYSLITENLRRYLNGSPLLDPVDKQIGY